MHYMHLSPAPVNWAIRVLDAPQVWGAEGEVVATATSNPLR